MLMLSLGSKKNLHSTKPPLAVSALIVHGSVDSVIVCPRQSIISRHTSNARFMAGSSQDIVEKLEARGHVVGQMIHFGFKRSAFQLPNEALCGVYPVRVSARGVNHLNLLVVSRSDCLRLEPQRFASMTYRASSLDSSIGAWCAKHGKTYRVVTGHDRTGVRCVETCLEMLDSIESAGRK